MARRFPPLVIVCCLLVIATDPAQAQYLDPGAGSIVVQAVIAGVLGVATVVKLYWGKIKGLLRRRSDSPKS